MTNFHSNCAHHNSEDSTRLALMPIIYILLPFTQ